MGIQFGASKGVNKIIKGKRLKEMEVKDGKGSDKSKPQITIDQKSEKHTFRKADGHIADTLENRNLLESVASSEANKLGSDKYGNIWHAKLLENGTQVWTQIRDGQIVNGGINQIPKTFNSETGLSALTKSN